MGALTWTIRSLGYKEDVIGQATTPKLDIPEPPVSESSPLPRTVTKDHDVNKRSDSMEELSVSDTKPASENNDNQNTDDDTKEEKKDATVNNKNDDDEDANKKDDQKEVKDDDDTKENNDDVFMDAKDEQNDK